MAIHNSQSYPHRKIWIFKQKSTYSQSYPLYPQVIPMPVDNYFMLNNNVRSTKMGQNVKKAVLFNNKKNCFCIFVILQYLNESYPVQW